MKILHTLVGYLAVIALPLHPFAFASPLAAIDYDGYVDTTQNHIQVDSDGTLMKHVLGTIVETCQTVTTQNYSDTIEARQLPAPVVGIIIVTVATVFVAVAWIGTDNPVRGSDVELLCRALCLKIFCQRREAFTQDTITKIFAQYPKYNWVICHSPYSTNFDGAEGTDWGYTHHELSISFVRTIGSVLLIYLQFFSFFFLFFS